MFVVRNERGPDHTTSAATVRLKAPEVLGSRYDNGSGSSLLLANLSSSRIDVTMPEEHREDWQEAIADHAYDDSPKGSTLHLHGYGYRWLTLAGRKD